MITALSYRSQSGRAARVVRHRAEFTDEFGSGHAQASHEASGTPLAGAATLDAFERSGLFVREHGYRSLTRLFVRRSSIARYIIAANATRPVEGVEGITHTPPPADLGRRGGLDRKRPERLPVQVDGLLAEVAGTASQVGVVSSHTQNPPPDRPRRENRDPAERLPPSIVKGHSAAQRTGCSPSWLSSK